MLVAALKQTLAGHDDGELLPVTFMADIQELVRSLFTSGQTELQSRHVDRLQHAQLALESRSGGGGGSNKLTGATRYRLTVEANASCVDLLVWAAMEEAAAESVLNRLADKIHSKVLNQIIIRVPIATENLQNLDKKTENLKIGSGNQLESLGVYQFKKQIILRTFHNLKS